MQVDPKKVSKSPPRSVEYKKTKLEGFEKESKKKLLSKLKLFNSLAYDYFREMNIDFDPLTIPKVSSMFVSGKVGVGKTTRCMIDAFKWMYYHAVNERGITDLEILSIIDLLGEVKDTYNLKSEITEKEVMNKYKQVPLLILDDFGIKVPKDWDYLLLYDLINYRYVNSLTTFYNSNVNLEQLVKLFGDERLVSRVAHHCKNNVFHLESKDKRI